MGSLMPEVRHVNAGSLFAQIVEEGQTWLRHWIGQRMSRLLDKAVDDLLGRERYDVKWKLRCPKIRNLKSPLFRIQKVHCPPWSRTGLNNQLLRL
jgi:hypothetical protein